MKKEKRKGKMKFVFLCIGLFLASMIAGAASKALIKPSWSKEYSVDFTEEIGKSYTDLSYGDNDANKFDLYIPADNSKENYGLVVYLHAGGFTSGDKSGDRNMLEWLCSKGYVTAGINYTLRTEENDSSVLSQSNEIKAAMPVVIEEAGKLGYHIDKIAMAGGSAGHCLAMIYAFRDGKEAPVPVVLTFGAVGPSCFYQEDWGIYGLDQDDEACAYMFSVMSGTEITAEEIQNRTYLEKVKQISAAEYVSNNPVPSVVAYGVHDKVQHYLGALRLKAALEENSVDHQFFVLEHSGHGLQNDNKVYGEWLACVEEYLDKYMPISD